MVYSVNTISVAVEHSSRRCCIFNQAVRCRGEVSVALTAEMRVPNPSPFEIKEGDRPSSSFPTPPPSNQHTPRPFPTHTTPWHAYKYPSGGGAIAHPLPNPTALTGTGNARARHHPLEYEHLRTTTRNTYFFSTIFDCNTLLLPTSPP
jgi:hypothetical protein